MSAPTRPSAKRLPAAPPDVTRECSVSSRRRDRRSGYTRLALAEIHRARSRRTTGHEPGFREGKVRTRCPGLRGASKSFLPVAAVQVPASGPTGSRSRAREDETQAPETSHCPVPSSESELMPEAVPMTTRQTPRATYTPIAATLTMPPWAMAESPQGRFQAKGSRTADREAYLTRTTPQQVSAVSAPSPSRRIPMSRDPHSPAPAHPDPPSTPGSAPAGKPTLLSQRTAPILFIASASGSASAC